MLRGDGEGEEGEHHEWTEATLVAVVHLPALSTTLAALLGSQHGAWRLGWSPTTRDHEPSRHQQVRV